MNAQLKTVLSSTSAPWIALLATSVSQALMYSYDGKPWRGEYFWSAQHVGSNCFPAILLTALAIAVDVWRVFAPERANLVASATLRRPLLTAYGALVALGVAIPTVIAFRFTMTTWVDSSFFWEAFAPLKLWSLAYVFVSLLSIFAILAACFLLALATNVAALIVVPIAALWMTYTAMDQSGLVVLGATTGSMVGFQPSGRSLLIQAVFAVAVIGLAYWAGVRWRQGQTITSWAGIGALALVLVIGSSGTIGLAEYEPTYARDFRCMGGPPGRDAGVCVSEQHDRFLSPLYEALVDLQKTADELGIRDAIPNTIVESYTLFESDRVQSDLQLSGSVGGWRPRFEDLDIARPSISKALLVAELTYPTHCPQLSAVLPPSDEFRRVQDQAQNAGAVMLDESKDRAVRADAARTFATALKALGECVS